MGSVLSSNSFDLVSVHGDLNFICTYRKAREAVQAPELFLRAWDECLELQVVDKEAWVASALHRLTLFDWRYEIGMHNGLHTVGGIVLAPDDDIHVGPCLSVFAQYVMPEYRNRGVSLRCMRLAERAAKDLGYNTLAYTHRLGDWRYETIYRRLHEGTKDRH
jgi:GNAT superfamily N-acetyltransferase